MKKVTLTLSQPFVLSSSCPVMGQHKALSPISAPWSWTCSLQTMRTKSRWFNQATFHFISLSWLGQTSLWPGQQSSLQKLISTKCRLTCIYFLIPNHWHPTPSRKICWWALVSNGVFLPFHGTWDPRQLALAHQYLRSWVFPKAGPGVQKSSLLSYSVPNAVHQRQPETNCNYILQNPQLSLKDEGEGERLQVQWTLSLPTSDPSSCWHYSQVLHFSITWAWPLRCSRTVTWDCHVGRSCHSNQSPSAVGPEEGRVWSPTWRGFQGWNLSPEHEGLINIPQGWKFDSSCIAVEQEVLLHLTINFLKVCWKLLQVSMDSIVASLLKAHSPVSKDRYNLVSWSKEQWEICPVLKT
jgi:hypothetical protein